MARNAKPVKQAKVAGSKAPANGNTIEIAVPESGTAEEAKKTLAKGIPGWDE